MEYEIKALYEEFLEDMAAGVTYKKYFETYCYEDYHSHMEIEEAQRELVDLMKAWLHENKPGEYVVILTLDYCIFVFTLEEAHLRDYITFEPSNIVK